MKEAEKASSQPRPSPLTGLLVLLAIIVGIAVFLGLGALLGIEPLYAGFAFAFYFGAIKSSDLRELPGALIGSLGGVLVGSLLHTLPAAFGDPGFALAVLAILATVYALIMGWAPIVINYGFMLLLTVTTIPPVLAEAQFLEMAGAILLAAAFLGGLAYLGKRRAAKT